MNSHFQSDSETEVKTHSKSSDTIPRIPINLRNHRLLLGINWGILIFVSCILPIIGWFGLHYKTTLKTTYVLSIFTPIFGAVSLFSYITRTVRLIRSDRSEPRNEYAVSKTDYRPLGMHENHTTKWALDYFDWNFALGFCVVTAVIAAGIAEDPANVRMSSLPLSVLILQVSGQMVLLIPARAMGMRAPFRISSYPAGEPLRPACFTIAEDIVAVDGKQGVGFRRLWMARWDASPEFRRLLGWMDVLWGITGLAVAAVCIGIIFGVSNDSVGWAVGKSIFPPSLSPLLLSSYSVPFPISPTPLDFLSSVFHYFTHFDNTMMKY